MSHTVHRHLINPSSQLCHFLTSRGKPILSSKTRTLKRQARWRLNTGDTNQALRQTPAEFRFLPQPPGTCLYDLQMGMSNLDTSSHTLTGTTQLVGQANRSITSCQALIEAGSPMPTIIAREYTPPGLVVTKLPRPKGTTTAGSVVTMATPTVTQNPLT